MKRGCSAPGIRCCVSLRHSLWAKPNSAQHVVAREYRSALIKSSVNWHRVTVALQQGRPNSCSSAAALPDLTQKENTHFSKRNDSRTRQPSLRRNEFRPRVNSIEICSIHHTAIIHCMAPFAACAATEGSTNIRNETPALSLPKSDKARSETTIARERSQVKHKYPLGAQSRRASFLAQEVEQGTKDNPNVCI